MQRPFSFLCALAISSFVGFAGCEKHSWDETKKLHQPHGDHDHGSAHSDAKHEEKSGDHAPETSKAKDEKGDARDTGVK